MSDEKRNRHKLTLWSTGIIAGLVLVLYLPVLIWSPWWGEDGYYTGMNPSYDSYLKFDAGMFSDLRFHPEMTHIKTHSLKRSVRLENTWVPAIVSDTHMRVSFNPQLYWQNGGSEKGVANKICNPLTILRIKWLEWTANF